MSIRTVYEKLPDRMQAATVKWYLFVHPRKSWFQRKKMETTHQTFVERFFDSVDEYEQYKQEFSNSPIFDICIESEASLGDEYSLYDSHKDACLKFYCLTRKREPEIIVETGVYHGVSTLAFLLALDRNDAGTLYSIDYATYLDQSNGAKSDGRGLEYFERGRPSCAEPGSIILPPDKDPGWIIPEELRNRWILTRGKSQRKLPEVLADLDAVDIFLHNSEYSITGMLFEFELAWEWLADSGLILSNHVDRNDAYDTFVAERPCDHGLLDFEPAFEDYSDPCSCGYILKH